MYLDSHAQEFQFVTDLEIDPSKDGPVLMSLDSREAERQISPCDVGKATAVTTARFTPTSTSTLQLTPLAH